MPEIDLNTAQFDTPHPNGGTIIDLNSAKFDEQPKGGDLSSAGDVSDYGFAAVEGAIPFADEIIAGVQRPVALAMQGLTGGKYQAPSYDELRQRITDPAERANRNPLAALAATMAGGLMSGEAIARGAPELINSLGTGGIGTRIAKAAGTGAVTGAAYGAGSGEGTDRLKNAAIGGAVGAGIGGAVSGLGSALDPKISQFIADESSGVTPKDYVASKIAPYIQRSGADVSKINGPLATSGVKELENLTEAVSQKPGGREVAEKYFENVLPKTSVNVGEGVKQYISTNPDYYGTLDKTVENGRAAASPLYKEAYKANQQIEDPEIDAILKTPFGKFAINKAIVRMQNSRELVSKSDPELTAAYKELVDLGQAQSTGHGVGKGLKLKTLDYVKREMDKVLYQADNPFNAPDDIKQWSSQSPELHGLRNDFVKTLDENDVTARAGPNSSKADGGAYAKARDVSGDYITSAKAMKYGRDIITNSILDRNVIKGALKDMSPAEQDSVKAGIAHELNERIAKEYGGIDDYVKSGKNPVNSIFNSGVRYRLSGSLPEKDFKALSDTMAEQSKLFQLRTKYLKGSPTAQRLAAMQELEGNAPELIDAISKGKAGMLQYPLKKATQAISNNFGMTPDKAEKIANALFEDDPKKQMQLLKTLQAGANQNKIADIKALKAYSQLSIAGAAAGGEK